MGRPFWFLHAYNKLFSDEHAARVWLEDARQLQLRNIRNAVQRPFVLAQEALTLDL